MSKSVIVGKGMLGTAFENTQLRNCLLFCSGVSNSREVRFSEFAREESLLIDSIQKYEERIVIYFSSFVAASGGTLYAQHKNNMEEVVEKYASRYLIIRLPQVVGITKNETLVSFFVRKIVLGEEVRVQSLSKRNLVDVEDVVRVVEFLVANRVLNKKIAVGARYNISALEIVSEISRILNKRIITTVIEGGDEQTPNIDFIDQYLGPDDLLFAKGYPLSVLGKYVQKLADFVG